MPKPTEPEKKAIARAGSDHFTGGAPGGVWLAVVELTWLGGESSRALEGAVRQGCPAEAGHP